MAAPWLVPVVFALMAQQDGVTPVQAPLFRSDSSLVLVRFLVARQHTCIDDLKPEDVAVLEDGAARKVTVFEGGRLAPRTIPLEILLLFDTSGSVTSAGLLDPLVYQAGLLDELPGVRLSVYTFNSTLWRHCGPTRDPAVLAAALRGVLEPRSSEVEGRASKIPLQLPPGRKGAPSTWLFEAAMAAGATAAEPGASSRMLVIFSDGFPTTNTRPEEAAAALSGWGILAYPVVLGHANIAALKAGGRLGWPQMAELYMADFARLADLTGGRSFDPPAIDLGVLRQIVSALAAQVACGYVAGFQAEASTGGPRQHRIEVKLRSRATGTLRGGARTVRH